MKNNKNLIRFIINKYTLILSFILFILVGIINISYSNIDYKLPLTNVELGFAASGLSSAEQNRVDTINLLRTKYGDKDKRLLDPFTIAYNSNENSNIYKIKAERDAIIADFQLGTLGVVPSNLQKQTKGFQRIMKSEFNKGIISVPSEQFTYLGEKIITPTSDIGLLVSKIQGYRSNGLDLDKKTDTQMIARLNLAEVIKGQVKETVGIKYHIYYSAIGAGTLGAVSNSINVVNAGSVAAGGDVIITATPNAGQRIKSWSGVCSAVSIGTNICNITNLSADATFGIEFEAIPPYFTTTWRVGTARYGNADNNIKMFLDYDNTKSCIVKWALLSDGSNAGQANCSAINVGGIYTLPGAGDYKVWIETQTLKRVYNTDSNTTYFGKLLAVTEWGNTSWTSTDHMFFFADHFNSIPIFAPNLSGVTSMAYMFARAMIFNQPIGNWNVSNVTNMSLLFASQLVDNVLYSPTAIAFNQDLSTWNTANVTNMNNMFGQMKLNVGGFSYGINPFNKDIHNWNVCKVTSTPTFFHNTLINTYTPAWGTSGNPNMSCGGVAKTDWSADNLNMTFTGNAGTQISFNLNLTGSQCKIKIEGREIYCINGVNTLQFTTSGNKTIEIVTDASTNLNTFTASTGLISVNSWGDNVYNSFASMFQSATLLTNVPATLPLNTRTSMQYMFNSATVFNGNIGAWNTISVTNMSYMFQSAIAFNRNIGSWNTSNVTNMQNMFYFATVFNQNIGAWNTINVTNMSYMFTRALRFNQPIGTWNVSHVTTFTFMFAGELGNATRYAPGRGAFNQDLSTWNTISATNMTNMFNQYRLGSNFYGVNPFNRDIHNWNVCSIPSAPGGFHATLIAGNTPIWGTNGGVACP